MMSKIKICWANKLIGMYCSRRYLIMFMSFFKYNLNIILIYFFHYSVKHQELWAAVEMNDTEKVAGYLETYEEKSGVELKE